jgi:allantoicase
LDAEREQQAAGDKNEGRAAAAGIARLNALTDAEAEGELLKCCGSTRWAQRMAEQRPFESLDELAETADRLWWNLDRQDWLEAFRSHPKIGEQKAARSLDEAAQRWSEEEQSGTRDAAHETLDALAAANRAYEQKFGHIFIVCATGKSTEQMLALLNERLQHDSDTELRVAVEEQRRITHLRLRKLLNA